jgi:hypothetical protein
MERERRLRRFEHPEAEVIWAAIETLDAAVKHGLLKHLRERLAVPGDVAFAHSMRVERAIAALREAAEHIDHSPSIYEYWRLVIERPELGWPKDGSIRRWLGNVSWNDALRRALLETVADGDFVVKPQGHDFLLEELVDAVRACVEECADQFSSGFPTLHQYTAWARRPEVAGRPGRRPRSNGPFRRFGGYYEVLKAAGLLVDGQALPKGEQCIRPSSLSYKPEDYAAGLRELAERLGGVSPRVAAYQAERKKIQAESLAAGEPRTIPASSTILKWFSTWDDALEAAGLERLGGRATRTSNALSRSPLLRRHTEERKLAAVREAWEVMGEPFSAQAYTRWRKEEMTKAAAEHR